MHGEKLKITIYSLLLILVSEDSCCLKFVSSAYCANELVRKKKLSKQAETGNERGSALLQSPLLKPAKVRSSDSRMWAGWARR